MPSKRETRVKRNSRIAKERATERRETTKQAIIDLYRISDVDRELIDLLVKYPDISAKQLCEVLDLSPAELARRRNKPSVKRVLIEVFESNKDILVRAQKIALGRLMKLINSPSEHVALKAVALALHPMLNEFKLKTENTETTEIIFRSKIGAQGQLLQDVEKVKEQAEKTTLDLLAGAKE